MTAKLKKGDRVTREQWGREVSGTVAAEVYPWGAVSVLWDDLTVPTSHDPHRLSQPTTGTAIPPPEDERMACECYREIDVMLAERNTRLSPTIIFSNPSRVTVTLETEVLAPKRGARPVAMLPTFCPFCGTRYVEEAA